MLSRQEIDHSSIFDGALFDRIDDTEHLASIFRWIGIMGPAAVNFGLQFGERLGVVVIEL
jgi:hypothetical protein